MTVKIFKLINGEIVIGEVTNELVDRYVLKNPANVFLQQTDNNGGVSVGMAEYMPYTTGNIPIRYSSIVSEATPDQKLENEYNRIYGSNILIASQIPS